MTITPLGVSALALLTEHDMHPYEMYQLLVARAEDRVVKVRPGSLYHTVDRLQQAGMVQAVGTEREGNRPERTTYAITDAGRDALEERVTDLLRSPAEEYPAFPLAVAEAHNLPADTVVQLLRTRLARLAADREFYRSGRRHVESRGVARRYWLDLTYQHAMLEAQIAWVTALVDELESGGLEWGPDADRAHHVPDAASAPGRTPDAAGSDAAAPNAAAPDAAPPARSAAAASRPAQPQKPRPAQPQKPRPAQPTTEKSAS